MPRHRLREISTPIGTASALISHDAVADHVQVGGPPRIEHRRSPPASTAVAAGPVVAERPQPRKRLPVLHAIGRGFARNDVVWMADGKTLDVHAVRPCVGEPLDLDPSLEFLGCHGGFHRRDSTTGVARGHACGPALPRQHRAFETAAAAPRGELTSAAGAGRVTREHASSSLRRRPS